jgi:DNA-binding NarL/FixJ family response regulator
VKAVIYQAQKAKNLSEDINREQNNNSVIEEEGQEGQEEQDLSKQQQRIEWRRSKVLEYLAQGRNQSDIAKEI